MDEYIKEAEYIKRADVLALKQTPGAYGMDISSEEVKAIQAADVRPVVHRHWKHEHLASTSGGTYEVIRCSECGWAYPMFETAYCPCCGADMRPEGGADG